MPRAGRRGLPRGGGRYSERKSQPRRPEINAEYGEGMAYGFGADATSEASVTATAHGVDEIFSRVDLLVYSAGIAKAAFISDFALGISTARCRSIWWAIFSAPASSRG